MSDFSLYLPPNSIPNLPVIVKAGPKTCCAYRYGTGLVRSGRARSPDRHDLTPKFALEVPMSDNA